MSSSSDLAKIFENEKKRTKKTSNWKIGASVAAAAMLCILLLLNLNLTSVINRRTPFMEYNVCFNDRQIQAYKTQQNLLLLYQAAGEPDPEMVIAYTEAYRQAGLALEQANDVTSENRCPGLEVLKD